MSSSAELIARLRDEIAQRGLSLAAAAELAGFQPGNLRRMLSGDAPNPRLKSLLRLLEALRLRLSPFETWEEVMLMRELARRRAASALTPEQLCESAGVSRASLKRYFSEKPSSPSLENFLSLCAALGVEIELVSVDSAVVPHVTGDPNQERAEQEVEVDEPDADRSDGEVGSEAQKRPAAEVRSFLGISEDEFSFLSTGSEEILSAPPAQAGSSTYAFTERVRRARERASTVSDVKPCKASREFSRRAKSPRERFQLRNFVGRKLKEWDERCAVDPEAKRRQEIMIDAFAKAVVGLVDNFMPPTKDPEE
ncbi:MAG: helix-turn-helix domain-containing protein [Myxococcales bacterium]|nr:helix-turn-helix domain-containing protein [Myxococcales bacterium]